MADIKSLITKMGSKDSDGGGGDAPAKTSKKGTIESTYQKKSQLEHILLRPDTYIGSVEKVQEQMWVFDTEKEMMVQRNIEYVPGLYKIFDEILVNAADNKQRDKNMDCIKINIDPELNTISVWNNGKGIPVVMHKDENMYVPTMIFGHLLTSSNYNDEEEKVTGGRNGYGAKLCNIFSTKFIVETASREYKSQFKQTWGNNMTKTSEPKVKDFMGEDFTKITFCPDLQKFKMDKLDNDIVALMSRRAYDVAASSRGVKVFLNNKRIPVKNFKDYCETFLKDKEDSTGSNLKIVHEIVNERWEVAVTTSDRGFQQMSFVNSIATTKGGRHVDHVVDIIVKQLTELLKKKNKGGIQIKPFQIKSHMWIFINCLIVNPTFDSQTKENMTLQAKSFGSKCTLSDQFITKVTKSGIVELILSWAKFKAQTELAKVGGKKQSKLKGIPKLEDANEAGTKNALKCTLILTEGDSAKSLAVSGLGVIGRDYYGVFPLKGKLLNVREATHKQILENQEINNLVKIIGLQYKTKYHTKEDMKSLRYGKVMIMTDQDQDGSHIKGLLINFIHYNWPELLRLDFLEEFITPIVKARKRNEELSFYSLPEFEEWRANTPNSSTYQVKYYKGLGTSTSKEAKEYFSNMERHRIKFSYTGQVDDDHIVLAFSKKHIEHRKEWLTNFMVESRRRKEVGLPDKYLYKKTTKMVSYVDFINLEFILFSNADNIRSIPSLVDGVKPGQRKVLYTCFKRNDKREVKVAQLAGSVAEMSAYHHGEVSLCMTIVNLAQNFVGSNNINLLEPRGQFGTRMAGGKDSASPRYIFTKMSPLTRLIFHPADDPLLKYEYDDNLKIEPTWYIPIIPMILVNGADGIGTGWMTKIPNYNPRQLIENIRLMMDDKEPTYMIPWYKNFKGTIDDGGDQRYVISGEVSIVGSSKIEITELPVGTWTQNYKENVLEVLLHGTEKTKAIISDYKEYNTDTTVKFVVTIIPSEMERIQQEGLHKTFKLQSVIGTGSMCVFDELGCIRKFDNVSEILQEFYKLRLSFYSKRKNYLEGMLQAEADRLSFQARFILEKCNQTLVVENKKRKTIIDELIKRGYLPDPVKEWKSTVESDELEAEASQDQDDEEEEATGGKAKKPDPEKEFNESSQVKKFDYLLGMSMWMLTDEKKNELLRQRDNKLAELEILRKKSPCDLWREDLDILLEKLNDVEEKERRDEAGVKQKDTKMGKKKLDLKETMPSPMAKRVAPTISDELKKKIQTAAKAKENKAKKTVKTKDEPEDADEFDSLVSDKKSLKDKIGTPEEVEKKVRAKKKGKDGLTQTKLNFKKVDKEVNGNSKKRGKKDDDFDSDVELVTNSEVISPSTRVRRNVKVTKYTVSSDEDEPLSDNSELFDNAAVVEDFQPAQVASMSDSESDAPAPPHETSEDMFDSLVGRKKETTPVKPKATSKRKKIEDSTQSDSDALSQNEKDSKKSQAKKKKEPNPAKKPRSVKKKVISDNDESDEDFGINKKKTKKKKSNDDSDEDFSPSPVAKTKRGPAKKYAISDDDSDF